MKSIMKLWRNAVPVQKVFSVLTIAALVFVSVQADAVFADHDPFGGVPQTSVLICHETGNGGFVQNSPNISSTDGNPNGHGAGHTGDIIPPYHWTDKNDVVQSYPGQNWGDEGEAIWENDCAAPEPDIEPGSITIEKVVTGDGADATLEFDFEVDGQSVSASANDSGVVVTDLDPASYDVSELTDSLAEGWTFVGVECDGETPSTDNVLSVDIGEDEHVTCTFTNHYETEVTPPPPPPDEDTATIIAHKIVCTEESDLPNWGDDVPQNAPITSTTAADWVAAHESCDFASDWDFQWAPADATNPGDSTGEAGGPWTTFGSTDGSNGVTLELTADDIGDDTFVWVREVADSDFIPFTYGLEGQTDVNDVSAEMYCHSDVRHYDNFENIQGIALNQTFYCVAWNVPDGDEQTADPGTLTVSKVVSNNKGGTAQSSDFTLLVVDENGATTTVTNNLPTEFAPGTYTVTETGGPSGYTATFGEGPDDDCDANGVVVVTTGGFFDCRITNTDQGGTLLVRKVVVGGNATTSDFSFTLNGGAPIAFEADGENSFETGAGINYDVVEEAEAGYSPTYDNCSGTIANGQTQVCTITNTADAGGGDNDPQTGTLIVQKIVINDDNGTSSASDFSFLIDGGSTTTFEADGENVITGLSLGLHSVSEVAAPGYSVTSNTCGEITVTTVAATCVITNDDNEPGQNRFTLTVTTSGEGEGIVLGENSDIDCDSDFVETVEKPLNDCAETYPEGTVVNIEATPDEGSNFDDSWSGACSGNNPICTITMTGNMAVNANFSLNSSSNGGGGGGGGGGNNNDDDDDGSVLGASTSSPAVLGTQIAQVPAGAPNTGAGGAAQSGIYGLLVAALGIYGFIGARKEVEA